MLGLGLGLSLVASRSRGGAPVTPALSALSLSSTSYTVGTPSSGTINGAYPGSSIALSNGPTGFTINSVARTWAYDGTGSATSGSLTLTETLVGATGNPRATVIGWTVAAVADTTAPTITSTNPSGSYAEMVAIGGTLTANETATFGKTGTDAGLVTLNTSTGVWSIPTTDYETKTSYSWTFTATDGSGNVGSQVVSLTITDVAEGAGTARTASTITRTSANTIPPSPTFSFTRPLDWADGDKAIARWSSTENMASPTEGPELTLAAATTSYNFINPDLTTGPAYIQIAAWNGTRPGTLNWSNIIGAGDAAVPTISSSASRSGYQNVAGSFAVTASKPGMLTIVGGANQDIFSVSGANLLKESQPGTGSYVVDIQWVSYAGVASATQTVTVTDAVNTASAFTFTDVTGASYSTQYTSNTVTVAGLAGGTSVPVSISGGTYSKNGGAYTSAPGTGANGDTFAVRITSGATDGVSVSTTLTIGSTSDTYSVATPGSAGKLVIGTGNPGTSDRSSYIDSTDGLTATVTAANGAPTLIKGDSAPVSTKVRFEMEILALPGGDYLWIGVTDASQAVGPYVTPIIGNGAALGASLRIQDGTTTQYPFENGTNAVGFTLPANPAVGDKYAVEYDTVAQTVTYKVRPNGSGTTTTLGTRTISSNIPTNPRIVVGGHSTGDSIKVNQGASAWSTTVGSGYGYWA